MEQKAVRTAHALLRARRVRRALERERRGAVLPSFPRAQQVNGDHSEQSGEHNGERESGAREAHTDHVEQRLDVRLHVTELVAVLLREQIRTADRLQRRHDTPRDTEQRGNGER